MPHLGTSSFALLAAVGLAAGLVMMAADVTGGESEVKAHLTLYVGGTLLREGGTVIVTSIPVPEAVLREQTGLNPAKDDPENTKRGQLSDQDLLLGAYITQRANFVRMYYSEDGTFGFNFVVDPRERTPPKLATQQVLVGGTGMPHPEDESIWVDADTSTIMVEGPKASAGESRMLRVEEWRMMEQDLRADTYQGVTIFVPTEAQLKAAISGKYNE